MENAKMKKKNDLFRIGRIHYRHFNTIFTL